MKYRGWFGKTARRRCPHLDLRGIFGDEIIQVGYWRLQCRDCGQFLDGPVTLAAPKDEEIIRKEHAEELAVRFELLAEGRFPVDMITPEEAASFAREIVCPVCGELDSDWCTRSWHRARIVVRER